jgi:polysaccharide deacetylase 2 family uncharacterized protein YibQ
MGKEEVVARLDNEIAGLFVIDGVSNHMGSEATEDAALMTVLLGELKKRNLFFLDSKTSEKSTAERVTRKLQVRYAERDVFLDNSNEEAYIKGQLMEAKDLAIRAGRAIAIGHDRKNTAKVLSEMMPKLAREGIKFVYVSELAR